MSKVLSIVSLEELMVTFNPKTHKATFQMMLPEADSVTLLGDFNKSVDSLNPLKKDNSGKWKTEFELPEGEFEFRYLVNHQEWKNDENLPSKRNIFGTENSVVTVKFSAS